MLEGIKLDLVLRKNSQNIKVVMRCDELQLEVQGFQNKELTSNQLLLMVLAFALFHGKLNSELGTDL